MNELSKRVISGLILATGFALAFSFYWQYYIIFYFVILLFEFLVLYEFHSLTNRGEAGRPFSGWLYFVAVLVTTSAWFTTVESYMLREGSTEAFGIPLEWVRLLKLDGMMIYGLFTLSLTYVFFRQITSRPLIGASFATATTFLGMAYVILPGIGSLLLLSFSGGIFLMWYTASINFMTDTGAYLGGKFLGRHPVGFQISPHKTYEGYVAGLLTAVLAGFLVWYLWGLWVGPDQPLSLTEALLIAPVLSFLAVVGDLAESALKRDAQIKDSASLIPGHGGALDLVDAMFFTVPGMVVYMTVREALAGLG